MVSISGIRGIFGQGLDPAVIVKYASAYGTWCRRRAEAGGREPVVIVGRDARVTGEICAGIVVPTLQSTGCHVVDAGLAATPTVEMAVLEEGAAGGVMLSASHNPAEWNALKLFDERGEFLGPGEAGEVIRMADEGDVEYVRYDATGSYRRRDYLEHHIDRILALDFIDAARIRARDFKVVVDGIDSVGGVAIPALLRRLGVRDENIVCLHCEPTGRFSHVAEPLPENLTGLTARVAEAQADLGIAVDPDADRLALVEDGGRYLSEELTQVVAADFLWRFRPGPFVTNLSSSRAVEDVAARYGHEVHRAPVGEINVVRKMQEVGAVLGGEGNGGVILPELHYGRDALVGVAMVLQHLANEGKRLSELRAELPAYTISKQKIEIADQQPDVLLAEIAERYAGERVSTEDGVKIDFEEGWVHLRKSNTEPIIRIYAEGRDEAAARRLAERFMVELHTAATASGEAG